MEIRETVSRIQMAVCAVLMAFSPTLSALGLGDAQVRSYLGQPLDIRIALIARSEEELASVTAGLASADDFQMMGLDSTALLVPLQFEVNRSFPGAYVRVTSTLPVNEPVVQVVLEVAFSSGRMLREYTMFLDPPTFAAPVPLPSITPREVPVRQAPRPPAEPYAPEPDVLEAAPVTVVPAAAEPETGRGAEEAVSPEPVIQEAADTGLPDATTIEPEASAESLPEPPDSGGVTPDTEAEMPASAEQATAETKQPPEMEQPSTTEQPPETEQPPGTEADAAAAGDTGEAQTEPGEAEITPEPEPVIPEPAATPEPAPVVYQQPEDSGEVYGPVRGGETMWAIASEFTRGSSYSINQAMLAIQRQNPEAFVGNNINALKRGAILRMPTFSQVALLSRREAMLEAMRQEEQYKARREGRVFDEPPVVADTRRAEPAQPASDLAPATELPGPDVTGRLELVPPSEGLDAAQSGQGGPDERGGGDGPDGMAQGRARTEEDIANLQQENEYLAERIRELEAQVAGGRQEGSIADAGLAEMESALREERLAGEPEAPVAVVRPAEKDSWYSGKTWWIAALLLVLVAFTVWLLRRIRGASLPDAGLREAVVADDEAGTVQSIKGEAEDILRTLEPSDNVIDLESYVEPDQGTEPGEPDDSGHEDPKAEEDRTAETGPPPSPKPQPNEEALELDADDPETKLDLARAYISMGDTEAARAMLEEVIEQGNEDQVAEAREMMNEV